MLFQRLAQVLCSRFQDLGTLVIGKMLSLDGSCILLDVAACQSLHNEKRECTAILISCHASHVLTLHDCRHALLLWTLCIQPAVLASNQNLFNYRLLEKQDR